MDLLKLMIKDYHFLKKKTKADDFVTFFSEVLNKIDVCSSKIDIEKILVSFQISVLEFFIVLNFYCRSTVCNLIVALVTPCYRCCRG